MRFSSPCELGGEGCDLWYSTRKRHALRLRIFSSLENHKLHKSAHPSIQGKSDITTPLILVKKINKASNELSRKSLSLRKLWRKRRTQESSSVRTFSWALVIFYFNWLRAHRNPHVERLRFLFSRRHPCLSWFENETCVILCGFSADCPQKLPHVLTNSWNNVKQYTTISSILKYQ